MSSSVTGLERSLIVGDLGTEWSGSFPVYVDICQGRKHCAVQSTAQTAAGMLWLATLLRGVVMGIQTGVSDTRYQTLGKQEGSHRAISLLRSWRSGDEAEQQATWEYLKRALDEDRLSERKLFP